MRRFVRVSLSMAVVGAFMTVAAVHIAAQATAPPPPKNPRPPGFIDPRNPPKEDKDFKAPRTPWGEPSIEGRWQQASDIITYSIEDPEADRAEHVALGGQRPMTGRPIIDPPDGKIPWQPWAAKYAAFLDVQHKKPSKPEYLDPIARGYQEGLPRINYQGAFQIQQFPGSLVVTYDYHHSFRVIPTDGRPHVGKRIKFWMGDSTAKWEEPNTLVVDVANNTDQTWFDIIGAFHSDQLHMVERWSLTAPDHIVYIVTIEDPSVYTQPWKLRVDFRRQKLDEQWENAVWEGNRLGGLPPEFWGDAKKADVDPKTGQQR
jgi:hypothetical protein